MQPSTLYEAPGEIADAVPLERQQGPEGSAEALEIPNCPFNNWQKTQKLVFDKCFALLLLILLTPLLIIIALLIISETKGPIIFCQPRRGMYAKVFILFKFRTMYAPDTDLLANQQTTKNDPRVTKIGRLLRRTSLDELPQLLNVLLGDMAIVGPRPHALNSKAAGKLFVDAAPGYLRRYAVKPGITGWAQINGLRGETKTEDHIRSRLEHDLSYINNWSLRLDCKIVVLTLMRELNSKIAF